MIAVPDNSCFSYMQEQHLFWLQHKPQTFDFSRATIRQLIRDGYEETLEQETKILQVWDSEHPR